MQLSRGESVGDTARILSRHVQAIGVRTGPDAELQTLAAEGSIPVFNMLTAGHHPSQALADLMTLQEAFPGTPLDKLKLAYVGDGNNVARSLARPGRRRGARRRGRLAGRLRAGAAGRRLADTRPAGRRRRRPRVYADVWVSMGDEDTADARRAALAPYRLDDALLDAAAPGAIALHCLPAHPGEEITADVLYGERQRIWDQAENRRHAQKALLEWLLAGD